MCDETFLSKSFTSVRLTSGRFVMPEILGRSSVFRVGPLKAKNLPSQARKKNVLLVMEIRA